MSMVVLVVIAFIVVFAIWYSLNREGNMSGASANQRITPQEYRASYAQQEHLLVDVRTPEEFRSGHIPGAVNIALQNLPQRMAALPKERPIVLYCRSGARSSSAAKMLAEAGFKNVHDLGGIIQWQAQGLPVN